MMSVSWRCEDNGTGSGVDNVKDSRTGLKSGAVWAGAPYQIWWLFPDPWSLLKNAINMT